MSASAASRLRQLATLYHSGELNLQSYRQQRAELLDRLTSSDPDPEESGNTLPQRTRPVTAPVAMPAPVPDVAVPAAVAPALAPAQAPPPAAQAPRPQPAVAAAAATPARKGGMGTYIVLALIALLGFGAVWFFYMRPAPVANDAWSVQAGTDTESYSAIHDFLDADDWSDEQIANFNTRWATLPDDMRASALDQPWYQNFVERVRSRVKEQRALTATAESAGTVEGPLASLASTVGIDISSPDKPVAPRIVEVAGEDSADEKEPVAHTATKSSAPPAKPTAVSSPAKTAVAPARASQPGRSGASTAQAASGAAAKTPAPQVVPPAGPDPCASKVGTRKPQCRDALSTGGLGPYLAVISKGEFQMGNKDVTQEQPVHRVAFAKPFAIGEFETSQAEYRLFCTETKRACEAQPWTGDDLPVVQVSWQDARDYVTWLSKVSGRNYRLATEAEWEFAVRSGGPALYPSGNALGQTDAVFSGVTRPTAPATRNRQMYVNTSKDNAPKLYHTIGNVREWVEDAWSPNYAGAPDDGSARKSAEGALRVVRGGAFTDIAAKLRFTTREGIDSATRDNVTGFRVVREL
jgi:formylglycine-generating enzyme required for sulfatase activity